MGETLPTGILGIHPKIVLLWLAYTSISFMLFFGGEDLYLLWSVPLVLSIVPTKLGYKSISWGTKILFSTQVPLILAFFVTKQYIDAIFATSIFIAMNTLQKAISEAKSDGEAHQAAQLASEQELEKEKLVQERKRVARELHDGVGADITALILQLRRLNAKGHDPDLQQLEEKTRHVLQDLRQVAHALRDADGDIGELNRIFDAPSD